MAKFEHVKGDAADRRFNKSRVHSVTKEYMDYLDTLTKEGGVGIITPGRGENLTTLRNRIRRSAGLLGIKVKTQQDGDNLLVKVVD